MGIVTTDPTIASYVAELEQRLSNLERTGVGAYQALASENAHITANGVSARSEGGSVRFVNTFEAGTEITNEQKLFTLPQGLRPPNFLRLAAFNISTAAICFLFVEESGVIINLSNIAAGQFVSLDTCTMAKA